MSFRIPVLATITLLSLSASLAQHSDTNLQHNEGSHVAAASGGLEHWEKVYEVFSHPRCTNCHVPEDSRPRWAGPSFDLNEGEWRYHGMNVSGGETRDGRDSIPCSACHATINSVLPHGPPGAPRWSLAPVEMSFFEKSSFELCAQIKDPARNGGRTLDEVASHIAHDPLIRWGWFPGPGREPAPYSLEDTIATFKNWMEAGAHCPQPN